jgi:hypothetical protein
MTPFAGHLASRKLLHTDVLSSIVMGLAIKMKTAQTPSIGLNYGPIGRKYWTMQTMSFNLRESIGRWQSTDSCIRFAGCEEPLISCLKS